MRRAPTIFWSVTTLTIGLAATWGLIHFRPRVTTKDASTLPPLVRSVVVHAQDVQVDVRTDGTVAARTEISLTAEVAGKVTAVSSSMAAGGFFSRGDVLVQLDDRDYRLAITQAESRIAQADLVLSREGAEADVARREWKQLGSGKPSPLTLREPQVRDAKAAVDAAKAELARAMLDLERTTVRAPFDGRVRAKHVDIGQFVTRGTNLARIYAVDYAEIRLPMHDSELQYVDLPLQFEGEDSAASKGPRVTLTADFAGREQQWEAVIVRTEGEINSKSRMVHAIARVDNPYARGKNPDRPPLAVGMFVNATIHGRVFPKVVQIPRDAIRARNTIAVITDVTQRGDLHIGRLKLQKVSVLRQTYSTAILRSGLFDGDRICLSPLATVTDGMEVRITPGNGSKTEDRDAATPGNGVPK